MRESRGFRLAIVALLAAGCAGDRPGERVWGSDEISPILEHTAHIHIAPDLTALTSAERAAVDELLAAGRIAQEIYELQLHRQAPEARREAWRDPGLRDLYRLFRGPIATTLENERVPFLAVDPEPPGKNVWPWNASSEEVEAFLAERPEAREALFDPRTAVRRAAPETIARDRDALVRHPALAELHPDLRPRLEALARKKEPSGLYAVPYSAAYADATARIFGHLVKASAAIAAEDPDFADYLRNRARDLLSDDYESGDAAWVTGRFGRLNAQIGAFETYDDALYGVKTFWSLSVLVRDEAETRRVERGIADLQALEESLPHRPHKRVRSEIPIGVYDVVADFGQARGTNTASILPNDPAHARKYGRTILMRGNILRDPEIFRIAKATFEAAVLAGHAGDLRIDGNFNRTLWHEIGHYLGPSTTGEGRELSVALGADADLMEELKADLVALFVAPTLERSGFFDAEQLRAVYASGVLRTIQSVRPRRDQPYQLMQLMQMNRFLDRRLLTWREGRLGINYAVYHNIVAGMLGEVLALQQAGDAKAVERFIERWATWDEATHGALAARLREASPMRYRLVSYAALGE